MFCQEVPPAIEAEGSEYTPGRTKEGTMDVGATAGADMDPSAFLARGIASFWAVEGIAKGSAVGELPRFVWVLAGDNDLFTIALDNGIARTGIMGICTTCEAEQRAV